MIKAINSLLIDFYLQKMLSILDQYVTTLIYKLPYTEE